MMKFNVKLDIERARREVKASQKQIDAGAARAIQRVAVTARKVADQEIRQRVTLKSGVVKNAIRIVVPYGMRTLIRDIVASGSPIPLRDYQVTKTSKGARFAIVRGQRKTYRRQGRPGFVIDRLGGHVFVRVTDDPPGSQKAKISKVFGPSITQRFRVRKVQQLIEQTARARWPVEFDREMKFRAGRV